MYDAPSVRELVAAVKAFIDETAGPQLSGHAAFHARVASNVLATVIRELDQRPAAEATEVQRLQTLLHDGRPATADMLNRRLCEAIRAGEISLATDGLLTHLKSTTISQLSIDQPGYSGLAAAQATPGG